jgi:hypothetical protein
LRQAARPRKRKPATRANATRQCPDKPGKQFREYYEQTPAAFQVDISENHARDASTLNLIAGKDATLAALPYEGKTGHPAKLPSNAAVTRAHSETRAWPRPESNEVSPATVVLGPSERSELAAAQGCCFFLMLKGVKSPIDSAVELRFRIRVRASRITDERHTNGAFLGSRAYGGPAG